MEDREIKKLKEGERRRESCSGWWRKARENTLSLDDLETSGDRTGSGLLPFFPSLLSRKGSKSVCNGFCSPAERCRPPNNVLQRNHCPHPRTPKTELEALTSQCQESGEGGGSIYICVRDQLCKRGRWGGTGQKQKEGHPIAWVMPSRSFSLLCGSPVSDPSSHTAPSRRARARTHTRALKHPLPKSSARILLISPYPPTKNN